MTPLQIEQAAREKYNAVGDTNWSSSEIMTLITAAQEELFIECGNLIENTYTTSTVIGTAEYAKPSNAAVIKRVTYEGKKLFPITMRDDDTLTVENQATTDTGEPQYYYEFEDTISLRPIPDAVGDLKLFAFSEPQTVTSTSTLEAPTWTHYALVDYVVAQMGLKDQNSSLYDRLMQRWESSHLPRIKKRLRLNKRGDAFAIVQLEEIHPIGSLGPQ